MLALTMLALATTASAGNRIKLTVTGSGDCDGGTGTVMIFKNDRGPDNMVVRLKDFPAGRQVALMMAQSPTLGAIPTHNLGLININKKGKGRVFLRTEIVDAFISVNQGLENKLGVADILAAGAVSQGANTIALDFIRGYLVPLADEGISTFGPTADIIGGGLCSVTDQPITE